MKRIHTLLFIVIAIVVGCQSSIVEFVDRTPDVSTGEVLEIGSTSVVLSGSFRPRSSVNIYDAVYCFCVYNHEDYLQNYYFDSFDYDDVVTKTIEISGLQSNTTYYYKFGAVHGTLNGDGSVNRLSPSEVWGEEKSFVTKDKIAPQIIKIQYNDVYCSYNQFNPKSVVTYDITVELDSPITEYVDSDCTEYGLYYDNFQCAPAISVLDSGKSFRCLLTFYKKNYTISYSSERYYAVTPECEVGLYMKTEDGIHPFSEIIYPGFEYTHQPNIQILNINQNGTYNTSPVYNYNRCVTYDYEVCISGSLFMDCVELWFYGLSFYSDDYGGDHYIDDGSADEYYVEREIIDQAFFDAAFLKEVAHGVKQIRSHLYFTDISVGEAYIQYNASCGDYLINSDQNIKFVFDGNGNVDISSTTYSPF